MQSVTIRESKPQDFEELFLLLHQLWPGKELVKDTLNKVYIQGLKFDREKYFCAELDKKVVGFCSFCFKSSLWQGGNLGYIGELIVEQSLRGRGIGSELLKVVFQRAKDQNCKRIETDSAFSRKEAQDFYLKMGFEKRAVLFSKEL
jgi:GNAT superfamily N-acetyltransferase